MLETERLVLRPLADDDADDLTELHSDPEVMRFLGLPSSPLSRFLEGGFYAGVEKASGRFIGWFALEPKEEGAFELGYRLHQWAWGSGFGTEGARALLEKAFTDLGATRVYAETMAVNTRSRHVMEKVGLRYVRTFFPEWQDPLPGSDQGEVEYALTRAEFKYSPAR